MHSFPRTKGIGVIVTSTRSYFAGRIAFTSSAAQRLVSLPKPSKVRCGQNGTALAPSMFFAAGHARFAELNMSKCSMRRWCIRLKYSYVQSFPTHQCKASIGDRLLDFTRNRPSSNVCTGEIRNLHFNKWGGASFKNSQQKGGYITSRNLTHTGYPYRSTFRHRNFTIYNPILQVWQYALHSGLVIGQHHIADRFPQRGVAACIFRRYISNLSCIGGVFNHRFPPNSNSVPFAR